MASAVSVANFVKKLHRRGAGGDEGVYYAREV